MITMILALSQTLFAADVTSIDFRVDGDQSVIEITSTEPLDYTEQQNPQDNQIILDLKDAYLSTNASRRLDTSSFPSAVNLISPYQVEGSEGEARIVVQLRNPAQATVSQNGTVLQVVVGGNSPPPPSSAEAPPPPPADDFNEAPEFGSEPPASDFGSADPVGGGSTPITLKVRDAHMDDVFRLISDASGFNIVIGKGVTGKVSLTLENVPWEDALDMVLKSQNLRAERKENILYVTSLEEYTAKKRAELEAKRLTTAASPQVTRVIQLSYADPKHILKFLETYNLGGDQHGKWANNVYYDKRTNSIIIQDSEDNVKKVAQLIEVLDTRVPQVLVEAKIVEASEAFARELGGNLGFGASGATSYAGSFSGGNPLDPLFGSPGVFENGLSTATTSTNAGVLTASPQVSFVRGLQRVNALLKFGENESKVKVVSSPKTVVLNKEQADIVQGTPTIIQTVQVVDAVQVVKKQIYQAKVGLKVTPSVTKDSNVLMDLHITRDILSKVGADSAVADRHLKTKVMVKSGETLVIGGIYTNQEREAEGGFPLLRHIPIIGYFFGSETKSTTRSELFIFITPKILQGGDGNPIGEPV